LSFEGLVHLRLVRSSAGRQHFLKGGFDAAICQRTRQLPFPLQNWKLSLREKTGLKSGSYDLAASGRHVIDQCIATTEPAYLAKHARSRFVWLFNTFYHRYPILSGKRMRDVRGFSCWYGGGGCVGVGRVLASQWGLALPAVCSCRVRKISLRTTSLCHQIGLSSVTDLQGNQREPASSCWVTRISFSPSRPFRALRRK